MNPCNKIKGQKSYKGCLLKQIDGRSSLFYAGRVIKFFMVPTENKHNGV